MLRLPFIFAFAVLVSGTGASSASETLTGTVTAVHDGDTFSIGKQRVRVFGIDAPELNQQCRVDAIHQPGPSPCVACGHASRDALAGLILNKEVQCIKRGQSY